LASKWQSYTKLHLGAFLDRGNYEAQLLGVQDSSQANLFPGMMDGILALIPIVTMTFGHRFTSIHNFLVLLIS
jgi:hypothetical protein